MTRWVRVVLAFVIVLSTHHGLRTTLRPLALFLLLSMSIPAGAWAQPTLCPSPPGLAFSDELCIGAGPTLQGFLTESFEPASISLGGPPSAPNPIIIPAGLFNSFFPNPSNQVYSIYLTDPGSTQISDLLHMTGGSFQGPQSTTGFFLSFDFSSDSNNPSGIPGVLPPACSGPLSPTSLSCSLPETGTLQDLSSFLVLQFVGNGITFTLPVAVLSDVERVPAPGSLLLLGSALAAITAWRRSGGRAGRRGEKLRSALDSPPVPI